MCPEDDPYMYKVIDKKNDKQMHEEPMGVNDTEI